MTQLRSIVTGGSGALGRATISAMQARGDRVVCLDQREPEDSTVDFVKVDVSSRGSVNSALEDAVRILGGIDTLVHAAGIMKTASFLDLNELDFKQLIDVNLMGTFRVAQQTCQHMKDNGGGRIVLMTSIHGQIGVPGRSAYAAAKGGIASLARVMAAELAEHRIRVNVLAPGAVAGGMLVDPRSREGWITATPSNRVAYLEEVAGVATLLTSKDASFVNGQIIAVDGGASTVRPFRY